MNFHEPVFTTTVEVKNNKRFSMLGLELRNDEKGPIIVNCKQGSPTAKIHRWKQILKNARLYSINDQIITSTSNIGHIIDNITGGCGKFDFFPQVTCTLLKSSIK